MRPAGLPILRPARVYTDGMARLVKNFAGARAGKLKNSRIGETMKANP